MESSRKVSVIAGFLLLLGFIVSVIVVIYHGSSNRSSYKSTVEESWRKREMKMKEKYNNPVPSHSQPSVQEAKLLAEELQKLFIKKSSNGSSDGDNDSDKRGKGPKLEINSNAKSLSSSKIPSDKLLPTLPIHSSSFARNGSSHYGSGLDRIEKGNKVPGSETHHLKTKKIILEESTSAPSATKEIHHRNEFHPTHWNPSINPRSQQMPNNQMFNVMGNEGIPGNKNDRPDLVSLGMPDLVSSSSHTVLGSNLSNDVKQPRQDTSSYIPFSPQSEWNEEELDSKDTSLDDYEEEYLLDMDERESNPTDPLKEMVQIFQVVNNLYKNGPDATDFSGILRVINDTILGANNTGLLSQLNKLYSRPGIKSDLNFSSNSTTVGRNMYENSIAAFVFMSFGIFLLKQIHNFAGEADLDGAVQGRNFEDTNLLEESKLDVLFLQPDQSNGNLGEGLGFGNVQNLKDDGKFQINRTLDTSDSPDTLNNMFRGALNLVNAYTKNDKALECIWSLYCQDLDKTAAKNGSLYSLAARINSIGLRLIMGQIPTELTLNVMLQSLLGWDGLPCSRMFPKCQVDEGTVSQMKDPVSSNRTSFQTT